MLNHIYKTWTHPTSGQVRIYLSGGLVPFKSKVYLCSEKDSNDVVTLRYEEKIKSIMQKPCGMGRVMDQILEDCAADLKAMAPKADNVKFKSYLELTFYNQKTTR